MSVSAVASSGYSDPNALVPVFASENAHSASEQQGETSKHLSLFGEGDDNPSFWDVLDVINPLQHIPIVNEIYQELTGDKIGVAARLGGGALFGGPVGLIASAIGCVVEEESGDSVSGHVLALFRDDGADAPQVANAQQPAEKTENTSPKMAEAAMAPVVPAADVASVAQGAASAAAMPAPTPMMFSADGMIAPAHSQAAAQPQAPVQVAALATAQKNTAQPMPLTAASQGGRAMPVPPRTIKASDTPPPPLSVPRSSSNSRSNVPITGRDPLAGRATPDPLAVQKAMAQQGLAADVQHPMLPNTSAGGTDAANAIAATATTSGGPGANADWFQAMNQALDKYQKAGNLAVRTETSTTPTLQ